MKQNDERTYTYYTGFLFALLFICFAGAIIGDSTAEALLLSQCNADILPKMFMYNAVALFLASALIVSVIDRVDRGLLFIWMALGHAAVLLLVRGAIMAGASWLFMPLFTYAYITKILLFLLFWTLANDLIDTRRAHNKFPLIAAGGTLGAIFVAFSIPGVVRFFAAENLLYVWSGCALSLGIVALMLRRRVGSRFAPSPDHERGRTWSPRNAFADMKLVAADPLLSTMALLYFLLFFALIGQHYFFYVQIKGRFITAQEIASFLGIFSGATMAATVLLQTTLAGRVLRKFGSSRSMLLLPTVLCAVFMALMAMCAVVPLGSGLLFGAFVAGMGLRMAFMDTFFSPNFQIFFSSLPQDMRGRAKLTLEGVVKPAAMILASVWLMAAGSLPLSLNMLCLLLAAIGAVVITVRLKARYARSLTRFLASFSGGAGFSSIPGESGPYSGFLALVKSVLVKGDFVVQKFLIDELSMNGGTDFFDLVRDHVNHPDPRVRASIVAALGKLQEKKCRDLLAGFCADRDERVRANAITAMGAYSEPATVAALEPFLSDTSARCRANAALALAKHAACPNKAGLSTMLENMLDNGPEACAAAVFALGEIGDPAALEALKTFARTGRRAGYVENGAVFRQVLRALAKNNDPGIVGLVLSFAQNAPQAQKKEIVFALSTLFKRASLPTVAITAILRSGNGEARNLFVKAFDESGAVWPAGAAGLMRECAEQEIAGVESDRSALAQLSGFQETCPGVHLLTYAVREESVDHKIETAIHAAALLDPSGAVRRVRSRLFHANPHVRARAFEVLDNAGDRNLNRRVLALLSGPAAPVFATAVEVTRIIGTYRESANDWIRRCAAFAADDIARLKAA